MNRTQVKCDSHRARVSQTHDYERAHTGGGGSNGGGSGGGVCGDGRELEVSTNLQTRTATFLSFFHHGQTPRVEHHHRTREHGQAQPVGRFRAAGPTGLGLVWHGAEGDSV